MAAHKEKPLSELPEQPSGTTATAFVETDEVKSPRKSIHDQLVFNASPLTTAETLLFSPDYLLILGLHQVIKDSKDLTLSMMKRRALTYIDGKFDLYKRQFSLPDRLVSLKVECAEGDFYLTLSQGYLCLVKDPSSRIVCYRLVDRPAGYSRQSN